MGFGCWVILLPRQILSFCAPILGLLAQLALVDCLLDRNHASPTIALAPILVLFAMAHVGIFCPNLFDPYVVIVWLLGTLCLHLVVALFVSIGVASEMVQHARPSVRLRLRGLYLSESYRSRNLDSTLLFLQG